LKFCKFKYEGIPAASAVFQRDDWVFMFDYKSGYHHLHIFAGHTTLPGCSFQLDGKLQYFKFTVLPFDGAGGMRSRDLLRLAVFRSLSGRM